MIPLIKWGFKERKWSILWWGLGIAVYIALNILVYSTVRTQADALNKVVNQLSPAVKSLVSDNNNILSPIGYLDAKLFYLFLPLLFSALTIGLGHSLLQREEQNGTLELLLSRPVSRAKLLLAKLIVGFMIIVGVSLIALATTLVCNAIISLDVSPMKVSLAMLLSVLLSLLLGSIAFMLSAIGRLGKKASVGLAAMVGIASYLATSLEGYAGWLKWPAKLLPYHYYRPNNVLHGTYNWWYAAGFLTIILVLLIIGFKSFKHRDIA